MWNKVKTKRMIGKVIDKYGKEIGIEGSDSVLGLEEHLDKMVADLMGLDLEVVKIARQWRLIIERAAITEGFDRINDLLGAEEGIESSQVRNENENEIKEVEMKIEVEEKGDKTVEIEEENKGKQRDMEDIRETKEIDQEGAYTKNERKKTPKPKEMNIDSYKKVSLDKSIWAPKTERCENKGSIQAKVAAINVSGDNTEHREKSLRWTLRGNSHIKKISEVFEKGNLWCVILFDCEKGYKEAKKKLENAKEEYEKLKLIPREELRDQEVTMKRVENSVSNKTKIQEKVTKGTRKKELSKVEKEKKAQIELKEMFKRRGSLTKQDLITRNSASEEGRNPDRPTRQGSEEELKGQEVKIMI
jgi:hypothetical protein